MDAVSIIKDSLRYSISDIRQLLILSVPLIILMLYGMVSLFFIDLNNYAIISIIYIILGVVIVLFYSGLMLNVIKQTVNLNHGMPQINLKLFLFDGLKYIVIEFLMVGIVSIILMFLSEYVKLYPDFAWIIFVFMIIFAILSIYLGILNVVASGKLAQTNSLADALSFSTLTEMADRIGKLKIYVTLLFAGIVTGILSFFSLLMAIPIIGLVIFAGIITIMVLFNGRVMGLLYNERYLKENNVLPESEDDSENAGDLDGRGVFADKSGKYQYSRNGESGYVSHDTFEEYIEKSEQEDLTRNHLIRCSKCGHSNPNFIDLCLNCGEKL
ncbi:MAG: DUF4013 domain-containing protein [Methanosphaera sp.]|nr:DUF4013 domain-containing protein [Methanosphaera sp.]